MISPVKVGLSLWTFELNDSSEYFDIVARIVDDTLGDVCTFCTAVERINDPSNIGKIVRCVCAVYWFVYIVVFWLKVDILFFCKDMY